MKKSIPALYKVEFAQDPQDPDEAFGGSGVFSVTLKVTVSEPMPEDAGQFTDRPVNEHSVEHDGGPRTYKWYTPPDFIQGIEDPEKRAAETDRFRRLHAEGDLIAFSVEARVWVVGMKVADDRIYDYRVCDASDYDALEICKSAWADYLLGGVEEQILRRATQLRWAADAIDAAILREAAAAIDDVVVDD